MSRVNQIVVEIGGTVAMTDTDVLIEVLDDVAANEKRGKQAAPGETWTAVRLPEAARERLDEMAREQERSVSFVLRKLVLDALERDGKPE